MGLALKGVRVRVRVRRSGLQVIRSMFTFTFTGDRSDRLFHTFIPSLFRVLLVVRGLRLRLRL